MYKIIGSLAFYALHPIFCLLEIAAMLLISPDHPMIDQFIQMKHQKDQFRLKECPIVLNSASNDRIQLVG